MANKLQILGNIVDVVIDNTLSVQGAAADAKATGDAISSISNLVGNEPVSEQITKAIQENEVDLTGYATESYVGDAIAAINHPVDSVNGKTGAVTLTASDVGADTSGSASSALDSAKAYTDSEITDISTQINNKADASQSATVTVETSAWTGDAAPYTATITTEFATADNHLIVGAGGALTAEQQAAMMAAMIVCTAQTSGSITLSAFGTKPEIAIPVNILVVG